MAGLFPAGPVAAIKEIIFNNIASLKLLAGP